MKFSVASFLTEWRTRVRLVLILALCGLGTAGVLGTVSLRWFRHRELAGIMKHEVEATANGLDRFLAPVISGLDLLVELGGRGLLDLDDRKHLDPLLESLMNHIPHISQAVIADSNGRIYEGTPTRQAGRAGDIVSPDRMAPADLLQRPWYKGAIDSPTPEQAYWTDSYVFSTLGIPGVTASRRYHLEGADHTTFVVALKISLADLRALAKEIGLDPECRILMLFEDEEPLDFNKLVDSKSVSAFSERLRTDATTALERKNGPVRLRTKRGFWWVGARESAATKARTRIVLAVPARFLLGQTSVAFYLLITGYLLALAGVTVAVAVLSRRSGRTLESLAKLPRHNDDSEDEIKTLIRSGENDALEFKSTLRWNLKANRADKNIERACLKTMVAFMNTEGGTLLVGVTDEGAITGIGADNFPNEDRFLLHFNNLIKEHIGLELAELISFGFKRIDDQSILVVDCGRSSTPVFLRHGSEEEEFYVRVGPGSRKLPTSKVLDYVRTR